VSRYERGVLIAATKIVKKIQGTDIYQVQSQTDEAKFYYVDGDLGCQCKDHERHPDSVCKHGFARVVMEAC
jgi:hypothetical protein